MSITDASAESPTPLSPVLPAFLAFCAASDRLLATLVDGGVEHFDNAELLAFMQDYETARNRAVLVDHQLVAAVVERDVADEQCQPNTARLLVSRLLISHPEARRRVAAAGAVGPRRSALGQPLEPVRPILAAAQAAGQASPEQVDIITRALSKVDGRGFDPAAIEDG